MKYLISKKFSLDFLGNEWKDCYINFSSITIRDLKENVAQFVNMDKNDSASVANGITETLKILEDRFIKGIAIDETGKSIDLKKEDLVDMPAEVLTKALSFLSQGLEEKKEKPSN
jgi:hypothetical protein